MRILVTAIGGDIGNGIGRILQGSGLPTKLIGCDIHEQHLGSFIFDECHVVPRVDAPDYVENLLALARRHAIDLIIPTSEPELRFLSKGRGVAEIGGIPLLMASRESLELGFDKLATARFLEAQGLPFPWTLLVGTEEPKELPCMIKSRFGAGSHDVRRVEHASLVGAYRQIHPDYIWQEAVGTIDEEYTCGVYRSVSGEVRTITFRRRLNAGITTYGVVVENPEIDRLCQVIAERIELVGSINVQLRLTARGPIVFEINPRFSSTVVFRHLIGFQDVIWSISEKMSGILPAFENKPLAGVKIFRKMKEVVV